MRDKSSNSIVSLFSRLATVDESYRDNAGASFLIENLPHIVFQLDASMHWTFLNPSWERTTGFQRYECLGSLYEDYIHPEDRRQLDDYFTHLQPGRRNGDAVEARLLTRHSDPRWTEVYAVQVIDSEGQPVILGTMTDISDRIAEEEVLHASNRSLSGILNDLSGMVYRCRNDKFWTMEYLSGGCKELTGYPRTAIINNSKASWDSLIHPEDHDMVWAEVQDGIRDNRYFDMVYRMQTIDNKEKWVWERGKGIFSDDGELLGLEGFITDVTEARLQQDRLAENLIYSPGGKLPQLPLFEDRLQRTIQASKPGEYPGFGLLMVQFHRLAEALERYGKGFETEVNEVITRGLLKITGDMDSVTRLKSERYAILIESCPDSQSISRMAQQILETMRAPIQHQGHTHFLTCSIGAANHDYGNKTARAVMHAALVAMNYAAAQGGSRFEQYDPEYVDY
jgi:PAS domain S-box-containing protein